MTRRTLRQRLRSEGVADRAFDLSGRGKDEAYCLARERDRWVCFYQERGERVDECGFDSESDACEYLLSRILGDPASRRVC